MAIQALQKQEYERDILVAEDIDPAVRFGAQRLITSHRAGAPVDIKSWGSAEAVYDEVTAKLIAYGMEQGLAQEMTRRFVDYAVEKAEGFQSEHQAKIIALRVTVAEVNPDPQFETGPVATFRLNGSSRQAEMASASGQNVRSTISGTATTTSDRSSVENVWQGVKEWSVWGKMEAPDKSELKDMAPAVIAKALAQMAAGELSAEEIAVLQSQLDYLAAEGLIAPELAGIVQSIETMRMMIAGGIAPDAAIMESFAANIADLITQGVENGNLPPELARQVMEAVAEFSGANGLEQVFTTEMMHGVSAVIEWTAITQALADIMPHLSAADRAVIEAMMESGEVPAADALAEQLAVINDMIAQAELPASVSSHVAAIGNSTALLQEIAQSQMGTASLEAPFAVSDMTALGVFDVQAMIQVLTDADPATLTPEQIALIERVDMGAMAPAQIEAALSGGGDPAIAAMIVEMTRPDMVALFPPHVQDALGATAMDHGAVTPQVDGVSYAAAGGVMNDVVETVAAPEQPDIPAPRVPDADILPPPVVPDLPHPTHDIRPDPVPDDAPPLSPPEDKLPHPKQDDVPPSPPEDKKNDSVPVVPVCPDGEKTCQCDPRKDFRQASDIPEKPTLTPEEVREKFSEDEIKAYGGIGETQKKMDALRQNYSTDDVQRYGGEENLLRTVERDRVEQEQIYTHIDAPDQSTLTNIQNELEELYFSTGTGGVNQHTHDGKGLDSLFHDCANCPPGAHDASENTDDLEHTVKAQVASDDDLDNLFDEDENDMTKIQPKQAPALRAA